MTTYTEKGCPFFKDDCPYPDHNHADAPPVTTFKDKLWDILSDATTVNADGKIGAFSQDQAQKQILGAVDEALPKNRACEKSHKEYFDWCSYCSDEQLRNETLTEVRQAIGISKGEE